MLLDGISSSFEVALKVTIETRTTVCSYTYS